MRIATLLITLLLSIFVNGNHGNRMQQMFADRTTNDWQSVWHVERHRRCYQELVSHMELVCRKDIYNLNKRNQLLTFRPSTDLHRRTETKRTPEVTEDIFLSPEEATSFLNGRLERSRKKRGIMDECCSDSGCSWEEYAEYCPTNRRIRTRS